MTYGYDSDIIKLVNTANFSTISRQAETLLNAVARVRQECQRRPLIFITHSLGGLIIKAALNSSRRKRASDLRAVAGSVFAVIFFGTPHRGSGMAGFALCGRWLESGADVKARFDGKTAIQSMVLSECDRKGNPHLEIIRQLIFHGADPNSQYPAKYARLWYPLLHIVAHLDDVIDLEARLSFMTFMCQAHDVDLNALDSGGRTFVEVLYWEDKTIPPQEWEILLGSGAKITKNMVSVRFHGLETFQEISDYDWEPTESSKDESEHPSPENGIIIASGGSKHPSEEREQIRTPAISHKLKLRRLCDGYSHHNAYQVLQKPEFRRREWYTSEAAKIAEEIDPYWFQGAELYALRH